MGIEPTFQLVTGTSGLKPGGPTRSPSASKRAGVHRVVTPMTPLICSPEDSQVKKILVENEAGAKTCKTSDFRHQTSERSCQLSV